MILNHNIKLFLILALFLLIVISIFMNNYKKEAKNVIFDLGANIGDSARFFVEPNFNGNDLKLKGICSKENKKWEIHSFEANPDFNEQLEVTKKMVENFGHKHFLYKQTAAWVSDQTMIFYLDTVNKERNFWGSSLHKEHIDAQRSGFKNIEVKALDISSMLSKFTKEDFIVLKIDIEGSEYEILKHLIRQNTIFLVDIISVEFHDLRFENDTTSHKERVNFYLQFFKNFDIDFVDWYLGHGSFLP